MIPQHAPVRQNDHHQLQFTAAVTTPQRWQWFRLFPRGKPQQKKQSQRHTRQPADFLNIDLPSRMLPAVVTNLMKAGRQRVMTLSTLR